MRQVRVGVMLRGQPHNGRQRSDVDPGMRRIIQQHIDRGAEMVNRIHLFRQRAPVGRIQSQLGRLQVDGVELPPGIGQQPGQVAQALGVLEVDLGALIGDPPVLALAAEQVPGAPPSKPRSSDFIYGFNALLYGQGAAPWAWYVFDNSTGESRPLGSPMESNESVMHIPDALPRTAGALVRVDLCAHSPAHASWAIPVSAYFRRDPDRWTLVGLTRESHCRKR